MATATFYEAASRTAKSAEVRALMLELLELARERDQLQADFARQVLANRARREHKAPKLSKETQQWRRETAEDASRAAAGQAARITQLSDEQLLNQALNGWDMAIVLHNPAVHHVDDREFALRIDRHNRQALRRIKSFYRKRGLAIPKLSSGRGISFVVVFQRAIPNVGTLGGDCMAIEPVLSILDKIAAKANVLPMSTFVNPDPEGLSGSSPDWFDAADGIETVRGLLAELKQSLKAIKNGEKVAEDLAVLDKDVALAKQKGVKFHFVMLD
jgi:multidrug efflux pump subunit AcrA (membrane-fusion protein)